MISFDIARLVPRFLMRDKNGKALAAAIEAALTAMDAHISAGIAAISNVDSMPEWRLDELAWEFNCFYDYDASIEEKREWIRSAFPIYRFYGTPKAVQHYLSGAFIGVEIEEWWQYAADPYHFRVTVDGEWTDAKELWTRFAIRRASNLRSVLDSIAVGTMGTVQVTAESVNGYKIFYPLSGTDVCGLLP